MSTPSPVPQRSAVLLHPTIEQTGEDVLQSALDAARLVPGTRVERYEIAECVGMGAIGIVYRVRHVQLGTQHALKVMSWAHPQLQARLLTEGRVQASLGHPNIVRVSDMLQVGSSPALLMEYVAGPSLAEWLEHHRPEPAQAVSLFKQILRGVASAHRAGVVHRDIKPANVLMARDGNRWVPKVTDFGLAKHTQSDLGLTKTGMTMGTPAYMAPEQIRGASTVDQRADIFALGCVLYEMICGQIPHEGSDNLEVLNAVADGQVRPVDSLVGDLPPVVSYAIRKAMSIDKNERFATCEAFLAGLDGHRSLLELQEQVARPIGKIAVAVGVVGLVTLLGAGAGIARQDLQGPPPAVRTMASTAPGIDRTALLTVSSSSKHGVSEELVAEEEPVDPRDAIARPAVRPPAEPAAEVQSAIRSVTWTTPESPWSPAAETTETLITVVSAEPPACTGSAGHLIGYVRVPRVFMVVKGAAWKVGSSRPVFSAPGAGFAVCTLSDGQTVKVVDHPVKADKGKWLAVYGGAIGD